MSHAPSSPSLTVCHPVPSPVAHTRQCTLRPTPTQAVATLAARILKVVHAPQDAAAGFPHKRNSELINSLLGISALMNEAGRR
ncbi:Pigment-dispersing hormone 2 peptide [Portunus trituberculatus]|uniref:Pigment-dispersing hormone 2 peptide n=1 Tax=Portunus trituberculatus TaxID=210409 RepID=A0A5B7E0D9_PORTR|nr:Pigment-dispersing hormone 2 peptide [Portunus trituberculatus]